MADASKVTVTDEVAERLGADVNGKRDDFKRVCELEHTIIKSRDALRVITHTLEDMAERHSTPDDKRELSDDEVSELYGTITLLDFIANECDRAFWEGAN